MDGGVDRGVDDGRRVVLQYRRRCEVADGCVETRNVISEDLAFKESIASRPWETRVGLARR